MNGHDSGNLFNAVADGPAAEEQFTELLSRPGVRIERIVSHGNASPEGFWYDQPQHEWVLLLEGSAQLRFADESAARTLGPGDYVFIQARRRHRVEATSPDAPMPRHFGWRCISTGRARTSPSGTPLQSLSRKNALNFIGNFMDQGQALWRRKGPKPFSSRNASPMIHKKPMKTMQTFETGSQTDIRAGRSARTFGRQTHHTPPLCTIW